MKIFAISFFVLLALSVSETSAQVVTHDPLYITFDKTTSIIFPYPIKSVDRGSRAVLAQKATSGENILQIKAGQRQFPETNLTVITADGRLHQFDVKYSEQPPSLSHSIGFERKNERGQHYQIHFLDGVNVAELTEVTKHIVAKRGRNQRTDKRFKVELSLLGVYTHGDFIFYSIRVENLSNVSYDVDAMRIFIRDKQKIKRTATQEVEVHPVFILDDVERIPGKSARQLVYVLPKVTIPDSKLLEFDLFEKAGGRDLNLKIPNRLLMKARTVSNID